MCVKLQLLTGLILLPASPVEAALLCSSPPSRQGSCIHIAEVPICRCCKADSKRLINDWGEMPQCHTSHTAGDAQEWQIFGAVLVGVSISSYLYLQPHVMKVETWKAMTF